MRRTLPLLLCCLLCVSFLSAQTALGGKVTDTETGEELIGANIILSKAGVYATGASTDFDGNYKVSIDPGTYDMEITYVGYSTQKVTDIIVKAGQLTKYDVKMGEGVLLDEIVVIGYEVPLIDIDNTTSGGTITSEQIRNLPTKDISALAATTAGLSQADEGDDISIRGSRADGTDYYIDGIRVRGSSSMIPQSEIDQLQVITGGIEAQYGDVTGGIISITTKGPSSKLSGGVEVETSQYLDPYGYNLLAGNVSGPILKNKDGESILGYRFSGQYRSRLDDDPPATEIFQVKPEVLAELEAQPVILTGSTPQIAAELLTDDDVNILDYQPNEESTRLDLTGKLDFRLSKAVDLTFTGSFSDSENRFTPNENTRSTSHWRLFNSQNNPVDNTTRYRGNFRFRHRLGNVTDGSSTSDSENASANLISNIQYTLQGGYEKSLFERKDWNHGDNLFAYGHVGTFNREWQPSFELNDSTDILGNQYFWGSHSDFTNVFLGFDDSNSSNPGLAAYNQYGGESPALLEDLNVLNGQNQNPVTSAWSYHTNVNQIYNLYQKTDNDLITGNVTVNFDVNPGGGVKGGEKKGNHSIQLGFIYEQRYNRGFDLNPRALWLVGRQLANGHISGIDTTVVIGTEVLTDPIFNLDEDGLADIHPILTSDPNADENGVPSEFASNLFFETIREVSGTALNAFDNIDVLNPDQLSLDMFSFAELNSAYSDLSLDYYGFDFRGNKLANTVTFDDFFTATENINGRTYKSRPVAPINPIYFAGYIQDKFSFRDIIFRVGVRVDRYDANTKVLRDPYSLYNIQSAAEFGDARPGVVEDDFKVYVTADGGNTVKAYRNGDQWYTSEGVAVNSGTQIFEGVVFPAYDENQLNSIRNPEFDPDVSFEDYEPQWNVMPRLAFSFPISEDAGFFAHYDILVQRPSAVGINIDRATALDYFNFEDRQPISNPNLKPQKTIDYEVGFQQKLTNSSSLKIAAYYKELRDQIARRTYLFLPAPVSSYESYGNLDFGTVKGFSFTYDLRRTNNVTLKANYTLQFADGTGSDADSQRGLTSRGNIRNLFPLNFDERHRIVTSFDYRYGSGSKYNGPTIAGKNILENAGVNVQMNAVSGRPFTATAQAQPFDGLGTIGQVNGSRLPWNTTFNMRIDKSFALAKPDSKFPLVLNVYFRIQNVLNRKNIINVYPATGSPSDDGFLISPDGISSIEQAEIRGLEDSFIDAYNWRMVNPNFFSLPRRMYLGATLDF